MIAHPGALTRTALNRSSRIGSRTTPTVGSSADDQPDAGAEVRDAGGVVDGAVERVDDPDPVVVVDGCCGPAPVAGPSPSVDSEWPDSSARTSSPGKARRMVAMMASSRPVIGLRDDVLGALLDDVLEALVVLDLDGCGGPGRLDGDGELGGVGGT